MTPTEQKANRKLRAELKEKNRNGNSFRIKNSTIVQWNPTLFICSFYRPPDGNIKPVEDLKSTLLSLGLATYCNNNSIIIAGDFNFPSIVWDDGVGSNEPNPTYSREIAYFWISANLD